MAENVRWTNSTSFPVEKQIYRHSLPLNCTGTCFFCLLNHQGGPLFSYCSVCPSLCVLVPPLIIMARRQKQLNERQLYFSSESLSSVATFACRVIPRVHTSCPSYLRCALTKCPILAFTPSSHNSRPSKEEHVLNFLSFISPICEKWVSLFLPVKKVLLGSIALFVVSISVASSF